MRNFLEKKRGQKVRLIIDMDAQKQPTHFYEGELVTLIEDAIILKDTQLGEVAVNPQLIAAIQILSG